MNKAVLLAITILGTGTESPPAPGNRVDLERIRTAVRVRLETLRGRGSFPGMTAGFVLPDGRSGSVAVGFSDPEKKVPMAASDRMLAGSIGKTYVSAIALRLVAEGKLDLDAKI